MKAYIKGLSNISPQPSIDRNSFLNEPAEYNGVNRLKCIEPTYKKYINPMIARRMSRIVKMGIYSALQCLEDAQYKMPDAIIAGTGLGCIEDTEKFLYDIVKNEEKLLSPTPFIQSTHNTISAQISLFLKCKGYNSTYVHRGFSFESALIDSLMLLEENNVNSVLLGGVDEMTNNAFNLTYRLGHWKREQINNMKLSVSNSKGSIAGEGSVFFLLTSQPDEANYAKISSIKTIYKPENREIIEKQILDFIKLKGMEIEDIDLVMLGLNGDNSFDGIYHYLIDNIFQKNSCSYFKHLCGEYHTSSSFAMCLAANVIKHQYVPEIIKLNEANDKPIKNILIYNHYRNINHSLILLQNA